MRLSELLKGVATIKSNANPDIEISEIFSDSRMVRKNGIFVAIQGEKRNGNDFIKQAIEKGAECIITDDESSFSSIECGVLVSNAREALAYMCDNYYSSPTKGMKIIAITGTNGKTSCAYYIYNILKRANMKRGLISTIECLINDSKVDMVNGGSEVSDAYSAMTTPDPLILYSIFNKMRKSGVQYVVMEASSHALEQSKLAPLHITVAGFTNFSPEHLDFHKDMEKYYLAKRNLFNNSEIAVLNADDDVFERLCNDIGSKCKIRAFSIYSFSDAMASEIILGSEGMSYRLSIKGEQMLVRGNTTGEFSVYNTMLAILCALEIGIEVNDIINGIYDTKNIDGRIERIANRDIFIDYAHTPHAMEKILITLRKIAPQKRIIVLFGCGGDRDRSKREKMGEIASRYADMVIVTSDNCRNENSIDIIRDILKGINEETSFIVIPTREAAIYFAIKELRDNDLLVLLGKGHENYEIDKNGKHYFSEKEIIRRVLENDKN